MNKEGLQTFKIYLTPRNESFELSLKLNDHDAAFLMMLFEIINKKSKDTHQACEIKINAEK